MNRIDKLEKMLENERRKREAAEREMDVLKELIEKHS